MAGTQVKGKNEETPPTGIIQEKLNERNLEEKNSSVKSVNEVESQKRSPFKRINNLTPTKAKTQHRVSQAFLIFCFVVKNLETYHSTDKYFSEPYFVNYCLECYL